MREGSANSDFFKKLNTQGYPAVQEKEQPWKKLVSAQKKREYGVVDKMVVVCAQTHDHGTSSLGGY
ncbi:hypothetical protein H2200_000960 [Cladophialophora chaetospira]|uniref:Uncharacterized protein n=1 Tax=Cladophialophora chaetospira TaxID=386627 RepID=A0AA38XPJ5_9EURO|nr:hypothetical protein H2200_000960 [Cladophialophora chaetospira]